MYCNKCKVTKNGNTWVNKKTYKKCVEMTFTSSDLLTITASPPQTFPPKLVLLDFGDMESMPEVIAEVLDCYGCVDILILNSSMKVKAPAQSLSLEMDKLLMDNNYFGPVTLAKGTHWKCVMCNVISFQRYDNEIFLLLHFCFRCVAFHDL